MRIYKLSDINKFFHDRSVIQKPEEEIVSYINNICKDNKSCEKYYYTKLIELEKSNHLNLENVNKIPKWVFKQEDPNNYPTSQKEVVESIKNINSNFVPWSIKQLKHIQFENYHNLIEDLLTYKKILVTNKNFPYRNLNEIKDEKQLYELVKDFKEKIFINTKKNWKGQWLYNDGKVSVFESKDEITIANISSEYNTRWCIKDSNVARDRYECNKYPMQFVFLDGNLVCVIHIQSGQIKDIQNSSLNDYGIIRQIDPILEKLNINTSDGEIDFKIYNEIKYEGIKINEELKLEKDKYSYLEKLPYGKLLCVDKNYALYNTDVKKFFINIAKTMNEKNHEILNLNSDIVRNIPEIKKEYKEMWIKEINYGIANFMECPTYIAQYSEIQNAYKSKIIDTLLNYDNESNADEIFCIEEIRKNPNILPQEYKNIYDEHKKRLYKILFENNLDLYASDSSYENDPDIKRIAYNILKNLTISYMINGNIHFLEQLERKHKKYFSENKEKLIELAYPKARINAIQNLKKNETSGFTIYNKILNNRLLKDKEIFYHARGIAERALSLGETEFFKEIDDVFNNKFSEDKENIINRAYPMAIKNFERDLINGDFFALNNLEIIFGQRFINDKEKILNNSFKELRNKAEEWLEHNLFIKFKTINSLFNKKFSEDTYFIKIAEEKIEDLIQNNNLFTLKSLISAFDKKIIYKFYDMARKNIILYMENGRSDLFKEMDKLFDFQFTKEKNKLIEEALPKATEKVSESLSRGETLTFERFDRLFDSKFSNEKYTLLNKSFDTSKEKAKNFLNYNYLSDFEDLNNLWDKRFLKIFYKEAREKAKDFLLHCYEPYVMTRFLYLNEIFENQFVKERKKILEEIFPESQKIAISLLHRNELKELNILNFQFDNKIVNSIYEEIKNKAIKFLSNGEILKFKELSDITKNRLENDRKDLLKEAYPKALESAEKYLFSLKIENFTQLNLIFENIFIKDLHDKAKEYCKKLLLLDSIKYIERINEAFEHTLYKNIEELIEETYDQAIELSKQLIEKDLIRLESIIKIFKKIPENEEVANIAKNKAKWLLENNEIEKFDLLNNLFNKTFSSNEEIRIIAEEKYKLYIKTKKPNLAKLLENIFKINFINSDENLKTSNYVYTNWYKKAKRCVN